MDFEALDRKLPFDPPSTVDQGLLDCFDYEYPGKDITVVTVTDEFTSVCPYSGLPDFGTLTVEYVPNSRVIELRSLKYYLLAYRNVGIFYEHLANRILSDLVAACSPKSMTVTAAMRPRGGLATTVTARYPH